MSIADSPIVNGTGKCNGWKRLPFIEANTKEVTIEHLRNDCIIPVFSKDNEVTVSHHSFIEAVHDAASEVFRGERVDSPEIRVSHIIKGRTPGAIHKSAKDLSEESGPTTMRTCIPERPGRNSRSSSASRTWSAATCVSPLTAISQR